MRLKGGMFLNGKLKRFYDLITDKRPTKPFVAGEKIIILSTAPSVRAFFEYDSVQKQFEEYDVAVINFMLIHSEELMHRIRPKFIVLIDSIFFIESARKDIPEWMARDCERTLEALERIDWDCYIITMPTGEWRIKNRHIRFIYLSILKFNYSKKILGLYKRNLINPGNNNVIIAAIYAAITFGYKEIALLGAPYRALDFEKKSDGLHIYEHYHYYDNTPWDVFISNDELKKMQEDFSSRLCRRSLENAISFESIQRYATDNSAIITNYSEGSQITVFRQGDLNVKEGTDLSFMDDSLYKYK